MELVSAEVETLRSRLLPFEEILVMPISDIQYGTEACDVDRFKRHIDWAVEKGNVYFVGVGDYVDFGSPSNRGRLKALIDKGELYDTAADILDSAAQEHLEQLEEILKPTVGKWLGLVEGHHFWEFADGSTSDTRLCQFLKAPFLGTCGVVEVKFKAVDKGHVKRPAFQIWVHHGRGSGQLQSAPLNKLENLIKHWPTVQVFFMAHHHKKVASKLQQPVINFDSHGRGTMRDRNIVLAGTGGWLRGYMVGNKRKGRPGGSYVEQGMMNPVALGGVVVYARPRILNGYADVDLDISL